MTDPFPFGETGVPPASTTKPDEQDGSSGDGSDGIDNPDKKPTTVADTSGRPTSTASPKNDVPIKFTLDGGGEWREERILNERAGDFLNFNLTIRVHHRLGENLKFEPLDVERCRYDPLVFPDQEFCESAGIAEPEIRPRQGGSGNEDMPTSSQGERQVPFVMVNPQTPGVAYYASIWWRYVDEDDRPLFTGRSASGLFTRLRRESELDATRNALRNNVEPLQGDVSAWEDWTPEGLDDALEIMNGRDQESGEPDTTTSGTSGSPTAVRTTPTSSPSGNEVESVGDSDSSGGGGGVGLTTGAIAGISVGAGIVALAIIGALIWFFCIRNRRKGKDVKGPYSAPDGQASEFMVNKETNAHVTESPHSPYSDDGSMARNADQQQQHHQQAHSYGHEAQPYSDAPPIAAPVARGPSQLGHASDRPVSRSGARSGTPAGNVSHLIEDGMTEDDIRRLEEEERALDDAIERAGHRQRRT